MPKSLRETIQKFNARMIQKFPHILDIESSVLFCRLCRCNINGTRIFNVQQHFRTIKHQAGLANAPLDFNMYEGNDYTATSHVTPPVQIKLDGFSLDLCTTFLEANIPLKTVDNPAMQIFLQKYTANSIPNETTLRSDYVPALYDKYLRKLQHKAFNKQIWISITETTDNEKHLIVNFVFGLLEEDEKGKSYLLNMTRIERATASALAAFINNSLQMLWPEGILYENVQLVVTESISYMKTALQSLKVLYPNMVYVTCLLQTYHRLEEYIRNYYTKVNSFINHCEEVFLKSPHRFHLMHSKFHYLKLPSISNNTSPGSWLKATIYYCNNYNEISTLLDMLNEEDEAECISQAVQLKESSSLLVDLQYIKQHFECLAQSIVKLETRDLDLNESLATIDIIRTALQDTKRVEFIDKFNKIITGNIGLLEIIEMNTKANNTFIEHKPLLKEEKNLWIYKYAPIVASDVSHLSYAKSLLENDKLFSLRGLKTEHINLNIKSEEENVN